jgi:RNA polymerase sigma factor (sigma-70 family)
MRVEGPPDDDARAAAALGERFVRHAPRVALVLVRRFGVDPGVAEDVVYQIYEQLHAAISRGPLTTKAERARVHRLALRVSEPHFFNYFLKSAANRLRDRWKHLRWEEQDERVLLRALAPGADPERELAGLEERAERERELRLLRAALPELQEPYRSIFDLFIDGQLPLAEVAGELGIPPGSIYTQFQRGLVHLRRLIEAKRAAGAGPA